MKNFYPIMVIGLMVVLPILSIITEVATGTTASLIEIIGKWFVFWGIGIRLTTAGISQILKPGNTAEGILGIKDKGAWQLVRELGFANLGIGLIGAFSLHTVEWSYAAALAGGIFLILAALEHIRKTNRSSRENLAMSTDLLVGIIAIAYFIAHLI